MYNFDSLTPGKHSFDWRTYRNLTEKQNLALDYCIAQPSAKVLYGGAGFGGKSYLLRSAALFFAGFLAQLGFPGQVGMLVCKDYPSLRDRHAPALAQEFAQFGEVKTNDKHYGYCFKFHDPALGALRLRNADESDKYRGTENAYILVDELTELPKTILGDLLYCLRSSQKLPFMPFLGASNPDGLGFSWVKKLWVTSDFTNENLNPLDFKFIQALPQDNPTYDGNTYEQTLMGLPEWKRKARLEGSWETPSGARYPQLDSSIHRFKVSEVFPHGISSTATLFMGVDWGIRDPYCALWIVEHERDLYVIREDYLTDLSSDKQAERITRLTKANETITRVYCDSQMWEKKRDPHKFDAPVGESAADVYTRALKADGRFGVLLPAYKGRRTIPLDTLDRLFNRNNNYPDLYIEENCVELWRELTGAVWASTDGKREDIDPKNPDHAITALYYAVHTHIFGTEKQGHDLSSVSSFESYLEEVKKQEDKEYKKLVRASQYGRRL